MLAIGAPRGHWLVPLRAPPHRVPLGAAGPGHFLDVQRPRSPWPALTAALLTGELGRPVTPAELGWGQQAAEVVSASSGLVLPWTAAGSLRAVRVVADAGSMDRRILLTLLGAAACAPAHDATRDRADRPAAARRVTPHERRLASTRWDTRQSPPSRMVAIPRPR